MTTGEPDGDSSASTRSADLAGHVFVSHASADRATAERIVAEIERHDIPCWVSFRDIPPGEDFQEWIPIALEQASVMLLLFSAGAIRSREVPKELALASSRGKLIVPVRIEDIIPSGAFVYQLTNAQFIDLFDNYRAAMDRLIATLARQRGVNVTAAPAVFRRRSRRPVAIAAGFAALVLLGVGGWEVLPRLASKPGLETPAARGTLQPDFATASSAGALPAPPAVLESPPQRPPAHHPTNPTPPTSSATTAPPAQANPPEPRSLPPPLAPDAVKPEHSTAARPPAPAPPQGHKPFANHPTNPTPPTSLATTVPPAQVNPPETRSPPQPLTPGAGQAEQSTVAPSPAPAANQTLASHTPPPDRSVRLATSAIPLRREHQPADSLLDQLGDSHGLMRADRLSHLLADEKRATSVPVDTAVVLLGDISAPALRRRALDELLPVIARPLAEPDLMQLLDGFNGVDRAMTLQDLVACASLPFDEAQTQQILADIPPPYRILLAKALRSVTATPPCPTAQR